MFLTVILSMTIVATNYLCFVVSKKESAKAIFIDSLIDVVFPVLSSLSFYNKKMDHIISLIQIIILSFSGTYMLYSWFWSNERKDLDYPNSALYLMSFSFLLTFLCCIILDKQIKDNPTNLSSKTTFIHFKVDFITKTSFILCALLFRIKNLYSLITFLEGANVLVVIYSSFGAIIPILNTIDLKSILTFL